MKDTHTLTFQDTEAISWLFLNEALGKALDEMGTIETQFDLAGAKGRVTIFFGLGCHNLVFHFETAN